MSRLLLHSGAALHRYDQDNAGPAKIALFLGEQRHRVFVMMDRWDLFQASETRSGLASTGTDPDNRLPPVHERVLRIDRAIVGSTAREHRSSRGGDVPGFCLKPR